MHSPELVRYYLDLYQVPSRVEHQEFICLEQKATCFEVMHYFSKNGHKHVLKVTAFFLERRLPFDYSFSDLTCTSDRLKPVECNLHKMLVIFQTTLDNPVSNLNIQVSDVSIKIAYVQSTKIFRDWETNLKIVTVELKILEEIGDTFRVQTQSHNSVYRLHSYTYN